MDESRGRHNNVRALRRALGWSEQELADAAGISQSHLSRIEHADRTPSASVRRAISAALDTNELIVFPAAIMAPAPPEVITEAARSSRRRRAAA